MGHEPDEAASPRTAEILAESGLPHDDALAAALASLEALGRGPAPAPSGDLLALLSGGVVKPSQPNVVPITRKRRGPSAAAGTVVAFSLVAAGIGGVAAASPEFRAQIGRAVTVVPSGPAADAAPERAHGSSDAARAEGSTGLDAPDLSARAGGEAAEGTSSATSAPAPGRRSASAETPAGSQGTDDGRRAAPAEENQDQKKSTTAKKHAQKPAKESKQPAATLLAPAFLDVLYGDRTWYMGATAAGTSEDDSADEDTEARDSKQAPKSPKKQDKRDTGSSKGPQQGEGR